MLGKITTRTQWLLVVLLAAACNSPAPEIRIGVLVGATGARRETSGLSTVRAAQLAEAQVNAAGGLLVGASRRRIHLVVRDIGDQADLATGEARELLNRDSVVVLIGPQFSRDAIPVSRLAEQAGVPMISPMSTHPKTTMGKSFVFRIAFTDDLQGKALARFARQVLHAKRAGLLYDVALDYSRNLAEVFQTEFQALGGTIVADERFTSDRADDFTAQLLHLRTAHPDVIFSPNFTSADSIQVIQARHLGLTATFLGSDSWNLASLQGVPEVEGAYYAVQWHPDIATAEADSFTTQYGRAYGTPPDATGASTWDAIQIVFAAIRTAGSTNPDSIRAAIAATDGFRGATGQLSFRNGGDPRKSVYIMRFERGTGVFQQRVDP